MQDDFTKEERVRIKGALTHYTAVLMGACYDGNIAVYNQLIEEYTMVLLNLKINRESLGRH